jgi:hypothetical protein
MAEANASLPKGPSAVIITLALREARVAVKRQLRDRGVRLSSLLARDITIAARDYFKEHTQELAELAWRKMQGSGELVKHHQKEQRRRQCKATRITSERNSEHTFSGEASQ